jgi:hypothetical protein
MLLIFTSCSTDINEPKITEEYSYQLSKVEAKQQAEILLDETITILIETIEKRLTATKTEYEIIKKRSSDNNFYSDGWYIWQNKVFSNPFGEDRAYNASYISKIQFNKTQPSKADTTKSSFSVHTKFGFFNSSIYGDEVDFNISTLLLLKNNNSIELKTNANYKRRWIGNYDGIDSDLHYNIEVKSNRLKYYDDHNTKWFEGFINISFENYSFFVELKKAPVFYVRFFKKNFLIDNYELESSSLLFVNNLYKQNKDIFPGYSSVNENFIKLLMNFPNSTTSIDSTL